MITSEKKTEALKVYPGLSPACERNKKPILDVIKNYWDKSANILEVGSCTGQHAVYFSTELPFLNWQMSDQENYLPSLKEYKDKMLPHLADPIPVSLGIGKDTLLQQIDNTVYDGVFTANTLHIMSWESALCFLAQVGEVINPGGLFIIYGPFKFKGQFTSESNKHFDEGLRQRDPKSGIRDFEQVEAQLNEAGFESMAIYGMPANNHILVFKKS